MRRNDPNKQINYYFIVPKERFAEFKKQPIVRTEYVERKVENAENLIYASKRKRQAVEHLVEEKEMDLVTQYCVQVDLSEPSIAAILERHHENLSANKFDNLPFPLDEKEAKQGVKGDNVFIGYDVELGDHLEED